MSHPQAVNYPLSNIDISPAGIQPRERLNQETVQHYAELFRAGETDFPKVYLWDIEGMGVRISDGYHRVNAAIAAGLKSIPACITVGTMADCVKDAAYRNACNGVQFTIAERRSALIRILEEHARENRHPGSLRDLANATGLSHETVRKHKEEWDRKQAGMGKPVGDFGDADDTPRTAFGGAEENDRANEEPAELSPEDAVMENKARLLTEMHDMQGYQKLMITKVGELKSIYKMQAGTPMGEHYAKHTEDVVKALEFVGQVVKMSAPTGLCDVCQGMKCAQCGGRGWVCRGNKVKP